MGDAVAAPVSRTIHFLLLLLLFNWILIENSFFNRTYCSDLVLQETHRQQSHRTHTKGAKERATHTDTKSESEFIRYISIYSICCISYSSHQLDCGWYSLTHMRLHKIRMVNICKWKSIEKIFIFFEKSDTNKRQWTDLTMRYDSITMVLQFTFGHLQCSKMKNSIREIWSQRSSPFGQIGKRLPYAILEIDEIPMEKRCVGSN